jgi:quinol monooxygenase YgiN
MIALIVTINIKPGFKERFMKEMFGDARGSNEDEPGCFRFDVIQDAKDPNKIYLYEVYKDQAALDAHRQAPHFLKWREAVKDWRVGDPIRFEGTPVYPPEKAWKKM